MIERAKQKFSDAFGGLPEWVVRSPGRVNLIGEHIDYNDGLVLPIGINRSCILSARVSARRPAQIRIRSEAFPEMAVIPIDELRPPLGKPWWSYLAGVAAQFQRRFVAEDSPAVSLPSLDIAIVSDLPLGSGLSSSAAVAMSLTELLDAILGTSLTVVEKARLCRAAEHEFAGVPCGLMDPLCIAACRADHCVLLDCQTEEYQLLPFDDAEVVVLIADTKVTRGLARSQYAIRRRECETAAAALGFLTLRDACGRIDNEKFFELDDVLFRRVRHVIDEIERVVDATKCLGQRAWSQFGELMFESHLSLRFDFDVSCPELDTMVEIAQSQPGVYGSRMTGAGFGGCTVSLVEKKFADRVQEQLATEYFRRTGIEPELFFSRPCAGVQILQRPSG